MRLAVKIGGSIAVGDAGPNPKYLTRFKTAVGSIDLERLVVGIGGGSLARNYLRSVGRLLKPGEAEEVVIELLRANTRLMAILLGGIPVLDEASLCSVTKDTAGEIFVIGGIKPGRSTDANTALLAEAVGADLFVKMTDVSGIYSADPDEDENAELIKQMDYDRALSLTVEGKPGSYGILDRISIKVLRRAGIPVRVIDGRDPDSLCRLLEGEQMGTLIS